MITPIVELITPIISDYTDLENITPVTASQIDVVGETLTMAKKTGQNKAFY